MKNKNKRGYSLVEVVIALSVIVIVSISALSIMLSSVVTKANAINRSHAQSFADNVWESFKAADTQDEFLSLIAFSDGVLLTEGVTDESGKTIYTYNSVENKFTAEIAVSYQENARPELELIVTDKNGDEIISFSYRKGDGI
ncbi:MAG: prepilin-type N-terminal cleavage/methylation domain-containing protein [Ruminococcaceae bacterium]|nr:prepilin-type N-terminal cleavage/methylation domain-containing protein [Oscillospiraceae bacterium]